MRMLNNAESWCSKCVFRAGSKDIQVVGFVENRESTYNSISFRGQRLIEGYWLFGW
jgi:hypothetical protein